MYTHVLCMWLVCACMCEMGVNTIEPCTCIEKVCLPNVISGVVVGGMNSLVYTITLSLLYIQGIRNVHIQEQEKDIMVY